MRQSSLPLRVCAASLLALFTACTSAVPMSLPTPSPSPPASGEPQFLSGPCPVSQPVPPGQVPKDVVDAVDPGQQGSVRERDFLYWYGNDALWVELPPGSEVVKPPAEELSEKFPWVRLIPGYLSIDGKRLDGPAPSARGRASRGYGRIGFQASGIHFPTTGCWEITGKVAGRELRFVVEARRQSA
jgi:hypothetical protein